MERGGIDVLLLDLELPDTNGLRILSELAAPGTTATPGDRMVSGRGQTDLAVKALRAGAVDCVDKGSPQFLQIVDIVTRVPRAPPGNHGRSARVPAERTDEAPRDLAMIEVSPEVVAEARLPTISSRAAPQQFELTIVCNGAEDGSSWTGGSMAMASPPTPMSSSARRRPGGLSDPFDVLCRKLRSQVADLPVILLAARNDAEAAVAAFKLGARDYILRTGDAHYLAQLVLFA